MRSLLISGLVVLAALLAPSAAQACSCAGSQDPEEQAELVLDNSDGAFIGVLASKRDIPDQDPFGESVFTYRVRDAFGARLGETVKIQTTDNSASCGLYGRVGKKYALGIYGKPGDWGSGLCSYMNPKALRNIAGDGAKLASKASGGSQPGCSAA